MRRSPGQPLTPSIAISPELLAEVDAAAASLDRNRSWVIREAIRLYLLVKAGEISQAQAERKAS